MKTKRFCFAVLIVTLLSLLIFVPVFADTGSRLPPELTAAQVIGIGILATVLAQVIKLLVASKWGANIKREYVTIGLFVIAVIMGYFWAAPVLPAFPAYTGDASTFSILVITFLGEIVTVASAVIGFSKLVYDLLLSKVFNALGWGSDKIQEITK